MLGLFKPTTIKTQTQKKPKLTGAFAVAKDPASSALSDAGFPQLAKPPTGRGFQDTTVPPPTPNTPTPTTPTNTGGKTRNKGLTDQFGNPLWDDGTPFTDTREEKPVDEREWVPPPVTPKDPNANRQGYHLDPVTGKWVVDYVPPVVNIQDGGAGKEPFSNDDAGQDQGPADETYTPDQQFYDWAYSQGWKQEVVRGEKVWHKQTPGRPGVDFTGTGRRKGQAQNFWSRDAELRAQWDKARGIVPPVVKPPVRKWNWGDNWGSNPFNYGQTKQKTIAAAQGLANGTGDDQANLNVLKGIYFFNSSYWKQRGWPTFDDFLESLLRAHYINPDPNAELNNNQVGV